MNKKSKIIIIISVVVVIIAITSFLLINNSKNKNYFSDFENSADLIRERVSKICDKYPLYNS